MTKTRPGGHEGRKEIWNDQGDTFPGDGGTENKDTGTVRSDRIEQEYDLHAL